ncbi:hypothetical protein SHI21_17920 [Bacteriovorax sp. PP10]|uniref:Lipocalin-like domain-containing protein n=1 Tax=Bacteriovorax antarcticus TaxID=3088717 RepID=A0ABU5VYJ8_9BACT|nr:hypothetical protein [Bacteriovorax sp. PP10]MEA9358116.1 hypothetical protein [Bacteriovorax sp. PP10]
MKSLLALTLAVTSFTTFAFDRSTTLDLTNVYGNNNAGLYDVIVEFAPKTTLSESSLTEELVYDDGYVNCKTSASFDIGEMRLTLITKKDGYTKSYTKKVVATVTQTSPSEKCIATLETLSGAQVTYSSLGINSITLPVKAPLNYKKVEANLAPFSGFLRLNTEIKTVNGKLVVNPSDLLTEANVLELNANHANLSYYVQATGEAGSLSLASGLAPLE